jgi:hypothetical protein
MKIALLRSTIFRLLMALTLCGVAFAGPVDYSINFSGVGTLPTLGGFTYDPSVGFSNFVVTWFGLSFDLTSAANAPSVSVNPPCSADPQSPSTGFALMSQSLLCVATDIWGGDAHGFPNFFFSANGANKQVVIESVNLTIDPGLAAGNGTFTITALPTGSATPEPSTVSVLLGALLLAGARTTLKRRS